jgi:uncharacterized protein YheU (UPF0270 family)
MEIPWQRLDPATLHRLIEEFVTRSGTDYGAEEVSHETKVAQVERLLKMGKVKIVFDAETESCNLVESSG